MLSALRHLRPSPHHQFIPILSRLSSTATPSPPPPPQSRWQRLKRHRRSLPTPPNRTKHLFENIPHPLPLALSHVRQSQWATFNESLDLIFRLNIDPRHPEQNLRGVIQLPHGTGRKDRVVVFADGQQALDATEAGADVVGAEDLIDKLKQENINSIKKFAGAVAVPHLLPIVASQLGRMLGPKGLMPSPKTGTVVNDVAAIVANIKRGWLSYRADRHGNVHLNVGKMAFGDDMLVDNILAAFRQILLVRPNTVKKKYVKRVIISSSMGPAVELDIDYLASTAASQQPQTSSN